MENSVTYRFEVQVEGNMEAYRSMPLYDDSGALVGAFTLDHGQTVQGFVSGANHQASIQISTGEPFYFTPFNTDNFITHGLVTSCKVNFNSIQIDKAL